MSGATIICMARRSRSDLYMRVAAARTSSCSEGARAKPESGSMDIRRPRFCDTATAGLELWAAPPAMGARRPAVICMGPRLAVLCMGGQQVLGSGCVPAVAPIRSSVSAPATVRYHTIYSTVCMRAPAAGGYRYSCTCTES